MNKEELLKLSPGELTDLGICPTCFNRENGGALYGDSTDKMRYADEWLEWFGLDFVTEVFDVDLDGIGKDVGVVVPDMGDDLLLARWTALVALQIFEHRKFLAG